MIIHIIYPNNYCFSIWSSRHSVFPPRHAHFSFAQAGTIGQPGTHRSRMTTTTTRWVIGVSPNHDLALAPLIWLLHSSRKRGCINISEHSSIRCSVCIDWLSVENCLLEETDWLICHRGGHMNRSPHRRLLILGTCCKFGNWLIITPFLSIFHTKIWLFRSPDFSY